tara:strand:- start:18 stop:614 length:597 start_codon:yes stop_codon:yes gene_type:complete
MFISFEGIEGSGKSTQIEYLKQFFQTRGNDVVVTQEPGGTVFGKLIRQIVLDPKTQFNDSNTELLLFFADRLEHIQTVIQPALNAGKIVLCDRYIDSTWAYQGGGRQLSDIVVGGLNGLVTLMPDITILFDIDPKEGLRRAQKRAQLDRFEQEDLGFHQKVRTVYLERATQYSERIHVIDVNHKSVEDINREVITLMD